jgi:hypothetical protein
MLMGFINQQASLVIPMWGFNINISYHITEIIYGIIYHQKYIYIGNHMVDFTRKEKVIPLVGDVGVYIYNGNRVKSSFLF